MNARPPASHTDPIDIAIGNRLRLRRLTLGMSQQSLARKLGVTFQQIQKYERGTNRLFASRLFHLAQALGVPVSYFFQGAAGEIEPPRVPANTVAEREPFQELLGKNEALRLIRAYNRIEDPVLRQQIYSLVKTVGEQDGLERRLRR